MYTYDLIVVLSHLGDKCIRLFFFFFLTMCVSVSFL
jgi:hypothetical protein